FSSTSLDIRNTAVSTDVYSEMLNAVVNGVLANGTGSGSVTQLAAGGTSASALTLGFGSTTFSTVGVKTGTVSVGFETDGTGISGLGTLSVGTQAVQLSGTVYRLAEGSLGSSTLTLASVREGQAFGAGTLTVYNVAGNDGFSEKLDVTVGVSSGSATVVNGTLGLLAAGSSNASTLRVSLSNTASAGIQTGTVSVNYLSNGSGTSGLAAIGNGSQQVSVSGTVYRLAVGSLSASGSVNLGAVRIGQTFTSQSLNVFNTAPSGDGFSDDLSAAISVGGTAFVVSGSVTRLAAGSSSLAGLTVSAGSSASAGSLSATATVTYTSLGQLGTGLLNAAPLVSSNSLSLTGVVYRQASVALNGGSSDFALSLGRVRTGGTLSSGSVWLSNSALVDSFSDDLLAQLIGTAGTLSSSGAVTSGSVLLAAGGSTAVSVSISESTATAGIKTGSLTVALTSKGQAGTGLADLSLSNRSV
ncbi:MAG: choice-of-anchor D domain-containing protein, partial [Verrucomicrobia bacterium]|nr:choice-of-anchor D domain-containing protein [Verrucomicrobiota bacterium]